MRPSTKRRTFWNRGSHTFETGFSQTFENGRTHKKNPHCNKNKDLQLLTDIPPFWSPIFSSFKHYRWKNNGKNEYGIERNKLTCDAMYTQLNLIYTKKMQNHVKIRCLGRYHFSFSCRREM